MVSFFNLLFGGCEEEILRPKSNLKSYVEGEIVVGWKKNLSLEEFIETVFNENEINVIEAGNVNYVSGLPETAGKVFEEQLSAFPFIDRTTTYNYNKELKRWEVEFWISGFVKENIKDWNTLLCRLQLKHSPNGFQSGLIKVIKGKEKKWIKNLSQSELFRFVDLNYLVKSI